MLKILFMGTPKFAVPILEALIEKYDVIGVVTQPDKLTGRNNQVTYSPVKTCALEHQIPVYQPQKIRESSDELIALNPDIIITAAYGQIVGTKLLFSPQYKSINVHGSLLPKYRGGAPIQRALMNGEKETGITIMYMAKGMDSGDILAQGILPITEEDTTTTLFDKLSILGRDLLLETLPKLINGEITPIKQNEEEVTFGYNIESSEEQIDFTKEARLVDCQIRSLLDEPGAYFYFKGFNDPMDRIKVTKARVGTEATDKAPGEVVNVYKKYFVLACAAGSTIEIHRVIPAGKKEMDAASFINGAMRKYMRS